MIFYALLATVARIPQCRLFLPGPSFFVVRLGGFFLHSVSALAVLLFGARRNEHANG